MRARRFWRGVERIRAHSRGGGIWRTSDRRGDQRKPFEPPQEQQERFVLRSAGQRRVINTRGRKVAIHYLGACYRLPYQARVIKIKTVQEKVLQLRYGTETIRLPGREERLLPVVVAGFGQEAMLLLTNLGGGRDSQLSPVRPPPSVSQWRRRRYTGL